MTQQSPETCVSYFLWCIFSLRSMFTCFDHFISSFFDLLLLSIEARCSKSHQAMSTLDNVSVCNQTVIWNFLFNKEWTEQWGLANAVPDWFIEYRCLVLRRCRFINKKNYISATKFSVNLCHFCSTLMQNLY